MCIQGERVKCSRYGTCMEVRGQVWRFSPHVLDLCVWVFCLHKFMCTTCILVPREARRKHQMSWNQKLEIIVNYLGILRIEPRSCTGAVNALSCWAISRDLIFCRFFFPLLCMMCILRITLRPPALGSKYVYLLSYFTGSGIKTLPFRMYILSRETNVSYKMQ